MKINEFYQKMHRLEGEIDYLLRVSGYNENSDLSELSIENGDAEEIMLKRELNDVMEKLSDVQDRMQYLSLPINETSCLHKNGSGKYETAHGKYFSCGSVIEALVMDDYETPYWVRTRVEHDGNDYYLVGYRDVPLDGLTVRVRGQ